MTVSPKQPYLIQGRKFDRFRTTKSVVAGLLVLLLAFAAPSASAYDYPVEDAFLSTVIGTATADEAPAPKNIPTRTRSIVRFPDRKISKAFWNQEELRYSVSAQKTASPLLFIIAGTGANYRSAKMLYLGRLFYGAGFHVISVSSPTDPNFILAASASGHPGFTPEDCEDLYAVMQEAYTDLASRVEISEVHLTGYSLGGTQSAFLMAIDDREKTFGFKKVLMINPSVDLFSSVRILDGLFEFALPDGAESVIDLADRLLAEISDYTYENGRRSADGELLYKIAEKRIAAGRPPTRAGLAGLIAVAFRLSAANMFFTVDVLGDDGNIVSKGTVLKVGTSLTPYFRRSMGWSFERYFDQVLLPYWQSRMPGLERDALIERASLRSLQTMLRNDPRIAAVTNADDIILSAEDLEFLRANLGDRVKIYPSGGHCGNLSYRDNAEYMIRYFKEDAP